MTLDEFQSLVQNWAKARGIYKHSTPQAQLLKAVSELGELADAIGKKDIDGIKDGIGDVAVCLVNYSCMSGVRIAAPHDLKEHGENHGHIGWLCSQIGDFLTTTLNPSDYGMEIHIDDLIYIAENHGLDFMDCCEHAWDEIKYRKGRMVEGGFFVKD